MSKRNPSVLWSIGGGNQGLNGSERSNARKNIGVNFSDPSTTDAYSLEFLSNVNNTSGTADNITFTKKKVTVDGASYNASNPSTNPASSKTIKKAIETLSVSDITGFGKDKTLSALSESNGKISASFQSIELSGAGVKLGTASKAVVTDASKNLTTEDLTVSSPSSTSGNTNAFVDTISQSATGKIEYTKKTLSVATSSNIGGVKSTNTGTTANRDYNVEVNTNGTMKVNVPWENSHYTSKTVVCDSDSGTTNTAVTTAQTVHLNHVENNTVASSLSIVGNGCNITSNGYGDVRISPLPYSPYVTVFNNSDQVTFTEGSYSSSTPAATLSASVAANSYLVGNIVIQSAGFYSSQAPLIDIGYRCANGNNTTFEYVRVNGPHTYIVPVAVWNSLDTAQPIQILLNGTLDTGTICHIAVNGLLFTF